MLKWIQQLLGIERLQNDLSAMHAEIRFAMMTDREKYDSATAMQRALATKRAAREAGVLDDLLEAGSECKCDHCGGTYHAGMRWGDMNVALVARHLTPNDKAHRMAASAAG